jgi:hypothetical protein
MLALPFDPAPDADGLEYRADIARIPTTWP